MKQPMTGLFNWQPPTSTDSLFAFSGPSVRQRIERESEISRSGNLKLSSRWRCCTLCIPLGGANPVPDNGDTRLSLHILSRHPAIPALIKRTMSVSQDTRLLSQVAFPEPDAVPSPLRPCVFVLDVWSLGDQVIGACRFLRIRHPGSKFIALVPPGRDNHDAALRLLFAGLDGTVKAHDNWCEELAEALQVILAGRLWFPREVISAYVKHTNLLLDNQFSKSLTARENQVLQLMIRRLSNKEIGGALGISERTARFHVSRIFSKLGIENRSGLFKTFDLAARVIGAPAAQYGSQLKV